MTRKFSLKHAKSVSTFRNQKVAIKFIFVMMNILLANVHGFSEFNCAARAKLRGFIKHIVVADHSTCTENPTSSTLYTPTVPTQEDIECIEKRQIFHKITPFGVSRSPCKHGFPQAFAYHPSKHKFSTNLFRLTCPKLVQAVDEYEKGEEQAIARMNGRLATDPKFTGTLAQINKDHSKIRKEVMGNSEIERMEKVMGKELAEIMLASGITGMSPTVLHDVKCLHAHLADYLCRGGEANPIGEEVYFDLKRKGVEVDGCQSCQNQCDASMGPIEQSSWIYLPRKNHQKLRQKAQRRKIIKENILKKSQGNEIHNNQDGLTSGTLIYKQENVGQNQDKEMNKGKCNAEKEQSNVLYRGILSSSSFADHTENR